ncbi:hypothetical protein HHI36_015775 [Cryptolaemus montrouzieri]|uniref:TATA element modulatory factor 1 TATA binding domain-containing protein n=1 Tax=Cryptolaemus montrouzieri TaxID=559131 RepID=A0ABD2N7E7_9CUCU
MSWFDAAGLANIAKSALKEAQRTIDKALDIKDDGINQVSGPIDVNDDFFGTWVENQPQNLENKNKPDNVQNSIWGSFTGSFFDHSREYNKSVSLEGLDDSADINSQQFSQSKLVVEENEECDNTLEMGENLLKEHITSHLEKEFYYEGDTENKEGEDVCLGPPEGTEDDLPTSESIPKNNNSTGNDICNMQSKPENLSGETFLSTISMNEATVSLTEKEIDEQKLDKVLADMNVSPRKIPVLPDAITVAPSRNNTQLLLQAVDETILIDTQPQSSKQEIPDIMRSTNIIDIPLDDDSLKSSSENPLDISTDEGSQSDRTIKASEDNQDAQNESDSSENNSTYLKNMLDEAIQSECNSIPNDGLSSENLSIIQLEMPLRENSPLSSDKSDLVKIGSDHTSGHTSGDELETATSSDIEIISSPNGDSSSTQSRQSPAKIVCRKVAKDDCQVDTLLCKMTMKNAKGHNRELSEASSMSDDLHSPEIEKLIRKITEMTEILESRESKIAEINRKNIELQELNLELKTHLNSILSKQLESQDLTQVTEDYAQRMSALEKKFQQAIREKDSLRKQLDQVKQESSTRLSKGEFDSIINDKDEMIKQLREEGEKLSRQQLQHSNIIKKLRTKEKENETTIKQLRENLEDFTSETERLKRTVNAKEEVERTQIEAVNQLTSKNKKLETDLAKAHSELDDQVQKYETLKKSLDAARKELNDKNKITNQLTAKELRLESLENEKKVAESQNEEVVNQLQYLRMKLHEYECGYLEKEQHLRQENNELLKRLENAESRNEELSHSILEVSKPLVRQLESLQATHTLKMAHFEKVELELTSKIEELQYRLSSVVTSEKSAKEECVNLRSKIAKLEVDYNSIKHQKDLLEVKLDQIKTERTISEQELNGKLQELQYNLKTKSDKIEMLGQEILTLKTSLEKALEEGNRRDVTTSNMGHVLEDNIDESNSNPRSTSPTLSVGKASVADSLSSSVWSQIESFDVGHPPRYTNMFEIQMLQTNLQQREGELQQLQWELNRREQERNLLNSELTALTSKVDDLMSNLADYDAMKAKFQDLQQQYDLLCQMYGEKVDEVEELKLDLLEAKEAYKSQLDELLSKQNSRS